MDAAFDTQFNNLRANQDRFQQEVRDHIKRTENILQKHDGQLANIESHIAVLCQQRDTDADALKRAFEGIGKLQRVLLDGNGDSLLTRQRIIEEKIGEIEERREEEAESRRFSQKLIWSQIAILVSLLLGGAALVFDKIMR